jgi:uncharacterized membrane protein
MMGEKNMRKEMKAGLLLFALFGILNVFFNTPEFLLGFISVLAIALMFVGGMGEDSYQRLKMRKKL